MHSYDPFLRLMNYHKVSRLVFHGERLFKQIRDKLIYVYVLKGF